MRECIGRCTLSLLKLFYHEKQIFHLATNVVRSCFNDGSVATSQDVLVTLEAEKGIITLPAKVKPVDGSTVEGISGGKYVGDNDPGSSIVFNDVEVPGSRDL